MCGNIEAYNWINPDRLNKFRFSFQDLCAWVCAHLLICGMGNFEWKTIRVRRLLCECVEYIHFWIFITFFTTQLNLCSLWFSWICVIICAGVRPVPLEIHIQGFDIHNFEARMQVCVFDKL